MTAAKPERTLDFRSRDHERDGFLGEARASNHTPEWPICRCNLLYVLVHILKFPQTPLAQSVKENSNKRTYMETSLSRDVVGCAFSLSPIAEYCYPQDAVAMQAYEF